VAFAEVLTYQARCDFPGCQACVTLPRLTGNFLRHDSIEDFVEGVSGERWSIELPPRALPVDLISGLGICKCPLHLNWTKLFT
jgi:hypothetical protein